jgi:glycosyltransferase involved in cell wall biosynthesis
MAARRLVEPPRRRAPPPAAADAGLVGRLLEVVRAEPQPDPEARAAAIAPLVEPWRAASPEERGAFGDTLLRHADPRLLRAFTRLFRAADALALPADAFGRSLAIAREDPTRDGLRYHRQLRGWAEFAQRLPEIPPRIAQAPRGSGRALYVLWRCIPYDQNGYVMRSHYLLRGLLAAGEEVVAVTRLGYPWDAEQRLPAAAMVEAQDGVTYLHLGGAEAHRLTMTVQAYLDDCADRIAMTALATGADVIHAASNWMAGLPALLAARRIGLPFCYEMRGLWEVTRASYTPGYEQTENFALFSRMEAFVAGHADMLFTITEGVREEMARRGVDTSATRIAPNGCEVARFLPAPRDQALAARLGIAPEEMVFGYIGSFAQYEGLPDLVRAAAALHSRGRRFRVLIVGEGPQRAEVEALMRDLDHGGRVILLDRIPFEEVPRYYSLVDVAVFPRTPSTITEIVSPLKPFEAMAMAKPVIASDVRALAEIVRHGETGWLFRKGDAGSLADTLQHALESPESVRAAGAAARTFVEEHHGWDRIARRIAEGWRDLRAAR